MPGEYPTDALDADGLPKGLRGDVEPKKAEKKTAKKPAKDK